MPTRWEIKQKRPDQKITNKIYKWKKGEQNIKIIKIKNGYKHCL
jgi:hypothetical protein